MSTATATAQTATEKNKADLKYYTASQWQLIWWRFKRHKAAMMGATILIVMTFLSIFAEFFGPYDVTSRDRQYIYGAPQMVQFWDQNGFSARPFIHAVTTKRDPVTLRKIATVDPNKRVYLKFFVEGEDYKLWSSPKLSVNSPFRIGIDFKY